MRAKFVPAIVGTTVGLMDADRYVNVLRWPT
jgi:hypothetical protein